MVRASATAGPRATLAGAGAAPSGRALASSRPPPAAGVVASDASLPGWAAQPGVAPRPVSGVVRHAGVPVDGATVELEGQGAAALGGAEARVLTGPDGRFGFAPRQAAPYLVTASAPGRAGATVEIDLRQPWPRPAPTELVVELGDCAVSVHGRVVDAGGTGIAGALVRRISLPGSGPFGPWVRADAEGAFALCVSVGTVQLSVSAPGYGAQTLSLAVHARHRLDVTLVPEGVVVGQVRLASTGAAVPRAQVNLWSKEPTPTRPTGATTVSDDAGAFELVGVAPGRYGLSVMADDAFTTRLDGDVVVEAAATTDVGTVRIDATALLRGVVVDTSGAPVTGASVRFATAAATGSSISFSAITQADGRFAARRVLPGDVVPLVEGYEAVSPTHLTVELAHLGEVRLVVRAQASVSGRVLLRGVPAAGVVVKALAASPGLRGSPRPVTSDRDGRYQLHGLAPGAWHLYAEGVEVGAFTTKPVPLRVEAGERREGVELVLDGGAAIAGVVVDQHGAPVAGAEVRYVLQGGDDRGDSLTADDGSFRVRLLAGGGVYAAEVRPYAGATSGLRAAAGGFAPVTVADGATQVTGIRLVVERTPRTISGVVVDAAQRPVPDAVVSAALVAAGAVPRVAIGPGFPRATSDEAGAFSLTVGEDGDYALVARVGNGAASVSRNVPAGASGVRLQRVRPGALAGTLRGFGAGVAVVARDMQATSAPVHTARVAGDRFAFDELAPGRYVVTAIDRAATDATEVEVTGGETHEVVLAARTTATLHGQVATFPDGAPAPGLRCQIGPRVGDTAPPFGMLGDELTAIADDAGRFTLEHVPRGPVWLRCTSASPRLTDGVAALEIGAGDTAVTVAVVPVPDRGGARPGSVGLRFEQGALRPIVWAVAPDSPAARAGVPVGGLVVAVDGVRVEGVSPRGIEVLIGARALGAAVRVTVAAGGLQVAYDLVVGPPGDGG
jgi:protocatechuate 3,4-dioxygenase beta subunit